MGIRRRLNENDTQVPTRMRVALERIRSYFKEYCSCSGIHGFRYLSEGSRSVFERLFWATAIGVSVWGCAMMVAKIKTKMDTTPVIVTVAENPTKNYHVPFPAVTLCPASMVRLRAFNFTRYQDLRVKNKIFMNDFFNWINESKNFKDGHEFDPPYSEYNAEMPWLSNSTMRNSLYKKLWALNTVAGRIYLKGLYNNGTLALDEEDMDFLVEVSSQMNNGRNFLYQFGNNMVYWKSLYWFLDDHFKHVWTEYGVCYAFNMMDNEHVYRDGIVNNEVFKRKGLDKKFPKPSNDWHPDRGYSNVLNVETYPWRAPHERKRGNNVLNIMMTENEEDIEAYLGKTSAYYTLLFHQPQDHPMVTQNNAINMPFHKFLDIIVRIDVMTTAPGLEKYDPHRRQCYYSHEKHLEYFKFYSQANCRLECLTNISLKLCGCVQFYMPRYKTTKICGLDASVCYSNGLKESDEAEISATLKYLSQRGKLPFNSPNIHEECDCLPNCLSVSYEADVLTTRDMDLAILKFTYTQPPKPGERLAPAGAWIRMQNTIFTATQRSEYYGEIDFLANCGGFLGLFCGFSILSFIEIFYFLTIRLWTNLYRRSKFRPPPELPIVHRNTVESPLRIIAFQN